MHWHSRLTWLIIIFKLLLRYLLLIRMKPCCSDKFLLDFRKTKFCLVIFLSNSSVFLVEIMNFQPIFNTTPKLLLLQREKLFQWIHWDGFCGHCVLTCPGRLNQHCKYISIWVGKKKLALDLLGQITLLLELAAFFHGGSYVKACAYFTPF